MSPKGSKKTLLIIDDDKILCQVVSDYFKGGALEVLTANTGSDGIGICAKAKVDVVLLDQNLPDAEGHTLCPRILMHNDQTKIIFITAFPSFDNAVNAIKAGAHDYLSKPFEMGGLKLAIERSLRTLELEGVEQVQRYKNVRAAENTVLVGAGLEDVRRLVELAADSEAPVLITGETGTGKNVAARAIHHKSPNRGAALISINCAALPESLIEDELFGHEKGAFTGASDAKKGIFELAERGTLVLDEIGDMPSHLQAKLLSVIEEKTIKRLGGESIRHVDVRVIATTNVVLEDAVAANTFRKDLYYRLSVVRIHMPALRERREDIPELCSHLLRKIKAGQGVTLPEAELRRLIAYGWPGNIRELQNILERAVMLRKGDEIRPSELLARPSESTKPQAAQAPDAEGLVTLEEMERRCIRQALDALSWNFTKTSISLGISLSTLKRKIKDYGL